MTKSSAVLGIAAFVASIAIGCKPQIGDSCKLSTDCSVSGDRLCDTSMPDGYCTIFNCNSDSCPGDATCVQFHPHSDRFERSFCVATCGKASDCRPGYRCVDPKQVDAVIIDDDAVHDTVCLP
jgi:hypothetical protein